MLTIQNDTLDIMARDITPIVVNLTRQMFDIIEPQDHDKLEMIVNRLSNWYGDMAENSVGATIYSTWHYMFYQTLLVEKIPEDNVRLALVGNYPFADFVQRMIHTLQDEPENERFNLACLGAFNEYKGKRACMYNMARAMV